MPYLYKNKILREGRGWTDDKGIKHPSTWASWSEAEKTAKGLVWQEPPAAYDNRFWWDAKTPKDIDTLKPEWVTKIKEQAGSLLAGTDWYVTREAETNVAIPAPIAVYRKAVRDNAVQAEADLMATIDHAEFVAVATSITWPDPDEAVINAESIKAERDRRIQSDFEFNGKMFQRDSVSLQRITGAATLAGFAIGQGAQAGDLRWANANQDFAWIAADNSVVTMDAQTTFAFGQTAASVETAIIFAAKALREMDPIPEDYADDKYWP